MLLTASCQLPSTVKKEDERDDENGEIQFFGILLFSVTLPGLDLTGALLEAAEDCATLFSY